MNHIHCLLRTGKESDDQSMEGGGRVCEMEEWSSIRNKCGHRTGHTSISPRELHVHEPCSCIVSKEFEHLAVAPLVGQLAPSPASRVNKLAVGTTPEESGDDLDPSPPARRHERGYALLATGVELGTCLEQEFGGVGMAGQAGQNQGRVASQIWCVHRGAEALQEQLDNLGPSKNRSVVERGVSRRFWICGVGWKLGWLARVQLEQPLCVVSFHEPEAVAHELGVGFGLPASHEKRDNRSHRLDQADEAMSWGPGPCWMLDKAELRTPGSVESPKFLAGWIALKIPP